MEIKSNKPGIARSLEENRTLSKAAQTKDSQSSPAAVRPDLKEGQQIKGTVLDLRYNEVKLQLEPGKQIVTARISGEVALAIGEEASFTVTEDSSNRLILKYLPENTAPADMTILKALTASGLPLTDRNKAILSELLKYRMPIDKQTLQTLIKAAVTNRDTSPQSLVLMLKNNIPLTASNIRQFEAYRNGSGKLLTDIQNLTKSLPELLAQGGKSLTTSSASSQLLPTTDIPTGNYHSDSALVNADRPTGLPAAEPAVSEVLQNLSQPGLPSASPDSPFQHVLSLNNSLLKIVLNTSEQVTAQGVSLPVEGLPVLPAILTETEQVSLGQLINQLPEGIPFTARMAEGGSTVEDVLKFVAAQLPQASEEAATALLQAPEYAKLLTEAFHQRWTLTPDKLEKKGSVSELYNRLQEDAEAINLLTSSEPKTTEGFPLQEPAKGLQENLQFMKDLNQMFTYLQLPIQLKDQDIPGELYIFTNKKALKTKKNLSVLLHLDLSNLGALNIHITMEHNQVLARFYPEEKDAISILKENVISLADTLRKKGYSFHSEVMDAYQKPDFVKDFIEQNAEESNPLRYSFDIRA